MKYSESHLDRNLRKWFENDYTCALLRKINLTQGLMRGLSPFNLDLSFPITAIAGKNGSGKSTLLALACCAYHNSNGGYLLPNRKQNYYTFTDFFIQHSEDIPASGITINYTIAHDNWRKGPHCPDGIGVLQQTRRKKLGGKWNDYASRVRRNVVFMGIDRIVPHVEKSQSKSYSRSFKDFGDQGWESDVKDTVGKILGKKYDDFKYISHSKYRLPIVTVKGRKYSGFHMGAGENALFELFSIMYSIPQGSLIVVDELELGLHSEAQTRMVMHLKELCKSRKLQVICTTHSKEVFQELPNDARIFIDNVNGKSIITKGISPEFAFSKMSHKNTIELCILVEDIVAKTILLAVLPSNLRSRIRIEVIGSASALSRQLASSYIREDKENILVVYDGDQRVLEKANIRHAFTMSESKNEIDFNSWSKGRLTYLPGNTWPERWLIEESIKTIHELAPIMGTDAAELEDFCNASLEAKKHEELHEIGMQIGLSADDTLNRICVHISQHHIDSFTELVSKVQECLNTSNEQSESIS